MDPEFGALRAGFVAKLPKRLTDLRDAEANRDWEAMSRLAHQLKGIAGSYGFDDLGRAAAVIESDAKANPTPRSIRSSLDRFDSVCRAIAQRDMHPH